MRSLFYLVCDLGTDEIVAVIIVITTLKKLKRHLLLEVFGVVLNVGCCNLTLITTKYPYSDVSTIIIK